MRNGATHSKHHRSIALVQTWAMSLEPRMRARFRSAQACACWTQQDWQKCACDEVFCLQIQAFRPRGRLRSRGGSCRRPTWHGLGLKILQNKWILKRCSWHLILVVDGCQTIASKTSTAWLWMHHKSTSQLFRSAHVQMEIELSNLLLSSSQSKWTRWVRETCLEQGLRPLMIMRMTASSSTAMYKNGLGMSCLECWSGSWSIEASDMLSSEWKSEWRSLHWRLGVSRSTRKGKCFQNRVSQL